MATFRAWWLPFVLTFSLITCCIEVDISVPGFPDMASYFGVSGGIIQLTIAYNFVGFCLAALFYGPLSECYGRRKLMVWGNALLVIGAVGCVMAQSINVLLFFRFIQGIGASAAAVLVFAVIADRYQGEQSCKLIAMMNTALTVLMAGAPVAGGFINKAIGWRGNYGVVATVCVMSWLLLFFGLPETRTERSPFNFKKVLRDYWALASSGSFMGTALIPSLLCAAYMAFVACCAFLYMETFELPVMAYVLHQGSVIGAFAVVSLFAGQIIQRWGSRRCAVHSALVCVLGAVAFVLVGLFTPEVPWLVTGSMIVFSMGFAVAYPVIFAKSIEIFPEIRGTASSAIMSLRALLCSVYVGFSSYCYDGRPITIAVIVLSAVLLSVFLLSKLLRSESFAEETPSMQVG